MGSRGSRWGALAAGPWHGLVFPVNGTSRTAPARKGNSHALRSQCSQYCGRRRRNGLDGSRHRAGFCPGWNARHRLRREARRRRGRQGLHRQDTRRAGTEGPRRAGRRKICSRPHRARFEPRGGGKGRHRRRGHRRAARREAGGVRQDRLARRSRHHHRLQHLIAAHHCDRRQMQAAGAGRRHALLQSGAGDAAGRGDSGPQDRAVGGRCDDGYRPTHDARAGVVHGQPGLPRQSCRPRLCARSAAHPEREHRQRVGDRSHPHRRARLQDGSVHAGRHGRHRCAACGDGIDPRPVLW